MHERFTRNSAQLIRKVFGRSLRKQDIGQTALRRSSMNFFGDFFEGTTIRVNTDEELLRIALRAFIDEETISGPNVYSYAPVVRGNELLKTSPVNLSGSSTAD